LVQNTIELSFKIGYWLVLIEKADLAGTKEVYPGRKRSKLTAMFLVADIATNQ